MAAAFNEGCGCIYTQGWHLPLRPILEQALIFLRRSIARAAAGAPHHLLGPTTCLSCVTGRRGRHC